MLHCARCSLLQTDDRCKPGMRTLHTLPTGFTSRHVEGLGAAPPVLTIVYENLCCGGTWQGQVSDVTILTRSTSLSPQVS